MRKLTPLAHLRRSRTLNQTEMASLLRVSQQTYSKYESGKLEPSIDTKVRIAAILGVGVRDAFPEMQEAHT